MIDKFIDYIFLEKKYSVHTMQAYKKDLESFLSFSAAEFEQTIISESSYGEIRSWIVNLVSSGISNRTINRKISSLNSFYKYLQRIEEIKKNPLGTHKALKVAKRVQVPFSEKEILSVLDGIQGESFPSVRDKLLVELLYSTGIRREELIGLTYNSVDFSNATIKVLGKRNKERYIPLLQSVKRTLEKYIELQIDI
jgi:integrase/recombinase XerC